MDTQEVKAKAQRMIVQNLKGIEATIKGLVTVKDAFHAKIEALTIHGMETYNQEYLEKEFSKVKEACTAKMAAAYPDMVKRLEELRGLIAERDAALDLANPTLANALKLIEMMETGDNVSTYETVKKINANFLNDQSSLRALRLAYKGRGIVQTAGLENMLYDADAMVNTLKEYAYQDIVQEGSINHFATAVAKLAALEGTDVEKMPDEQGALALMRAAAGLPAPDKVTK